MKWRLAQSSQRQRMIILVSKYDHCLVDLLYTATRAANWPATFR
jgi:formyltetrahydrofolate hydrolase